jgi:hypothetical protein
MRFYFIKREDGSITPLILGFTIIIAAVIATLSDITYLGNAHLALKSEGERLLAEGMQNLSAQDYYEGSSVTGSSVTGSSVTGSSGMGNSVPIDCVSTYFNILRAAQVTPFYLSNRPITIEGYTCKNSWVEFEISAKVSLPFLPRFLADVNPTVTSLISGGSRYFSD